MRNPLTFRIESWVGSVFVLAFSAFLVGIFFIALKNFDSESVILDSSSTQLKTVSYSEKVSIDGWLLENNLDLSAQDVGYRFIIKKYPSKPWLDK